MSNNSVNAKDVAIYLDDENGVLVEISCQANSVQFTVTQDLGEYKVFQKRWMKRLAGGKDGTFQIDIVFTTGQDEGYALIRDWVMDDDESPQPRTLRIIVPRNDSGSDSYQAEVLVASEDVPLDATEAAPIMVSVELRPDGPITHEVTTT